MDRTCIIVGAGQAGGQTVASLRAEGYDGRIILLGDEKVLPYQRPPLSKKYLAGDITLDRLLLKPEEFYESANAEVECGISVGSIDRAQKYVHLSDGRKLSYSELVLATGSRVRRLPLPGAELTGIHYLRTVADVDAIKQDFAPGRRLAVVGGGYIGLEAAAVAVKHGMAVTVLEMAPQLLARVVAGPMAKFFARVHCEEGVSIRTEAAVLAFEGAERLQALRCAEGSRVEADFAIIGVGILPNCEIAAQAGLACENGIIVDEFARTSDPNIYAAGDCTNLPSALYGKRVRLESVQNAIDQAKVAAAAICGKARPYNEVPWFWSDQYDIKLQIAGLSQDHDEIVIRGDIGSRSFALFYCKKGVLVAVDAVNRIPEFMMSKKLIARKAVIARERLCDENINMKEMA
jgi:3-phenylpropionate/trans-cinnamate dioxygenase ferredoxin reductase subunit